MDRPLDLFKVSDKLTINEAIRKMDKAGFGFICIIDEADHVAGVVSNGDFRRAVLRGVSLEKPITAIMNSHYKSLNVGFTQAQALELVTQVDAEHIPVLENGRLVTVINIEDFLPKDHRRYYKENCHVPLVVMAGGQGTRLAPFTHILPKPLMPIGEKPVIEHILSEFSSFGIKDILISVNHKARIIKAYFEEMDAAYRIRFFEERSPLGTAGSLRMMKDALRETFFMTNCDILVRMNYWEAYNFHKEKGFDLTIIAALKQYVLPYGICHVHDEGDLERLEEKPELRLLINTGVYVMEPSVFEIIPDGQHNMDELIKGLQKHGRKVGVFPIPEKAFVDIGQLDEYKAVLQKIGTTMAPDFNIGVQE
jgi:dTDP-glucose pyrophosphorylase